MPGHIHKAGSVGMLLFVYFFFMIKRWNDNLNDICIYFCFLLALRLGNLSGASFSFHNIVKDYTTHLYQQFVLQELSPGLVLWLMKLFIRPLMSHSDKVFASVIFYCVCTSNVLYWFAIGLKINYVENHMKIMLLWAIR